MKEIIKFEFLKIITNKLFIYTLIGFIISNIVLLIYTENNASKNEIPYSAYKIMNEEIKDLNAEEKKELINREYERVYAFSIINRINNLQKENNEAKQEYAKSLKEENIEIYEKYINEYKTAKYKYTGDMSKELIFLEEIQADNNLSNNYKQEIQNILEKAENLETISIFKENTDDFSSRNIKDVAKNYKNIQNTKIDYQISKGIQNFTKMGFTDIFIILITFVISNIIIFEEREKNLFPLIKSTKNGRTKTIISKIVTLISFIIIISIIMYLINFIYYGITIGYGNLFASLQSITKFMYSTLQINILGYIGIFMATKILAFSIISLFILVISIFAKNNTTSYIGSLIFLVISFLMFNKIDPNSEYNFFRYINIINLIEVNGIYETYTNLKILNHFKDVLTLSVFFGIILLIALSIIGWLSFNIKKDMQIRERGFLSKLKRIYIKNKQVKSKVFSFELYKLCVTNKVAIVLIIFMLLQIYNLNNLKPVSYDEDIYKNYLNILEGKITKEKEEFIENEKKKFEDAENKIEEIQEKVANNEISEVDSIFYRTPYEEILSTKPIFERVLAQYEYVKSSFGREFVYDTGYIEILRISKNAFIQNDIYMLVLGIICFTSIYVMEYKTGVINILNATSKGRKDTSKNKIISCILVSSIIYGIMMISEIIQIKEIYGFSNIIAPINSISYFEFMPSFINIFTYIIIMYIVRFIIFMAIILFILWISLKTKNTTYAILITSGILIMPIILSLLGLEFMRLFSLIFSLNITKILLSGGKIQYIYLIIPLIIGVFSYNELIKKFE